MRIRVKFLKDSLSSMSFSMSRSGPIEKAVYRRPRCWLGVALVSSIVITALLVHCLDLLCRGSPEQSRPLSLQSEKRARTFHSPGLENLFRTRPKAVVLVLCRNSDREKLAVTLANFEHRFNRQFRYPYVFLNDEAFDGCFMQEISAVIKEGSGAQVQFGQIPREHWSYPHWINQTRALESRTAMGAQGVIYGGSESYRFMCRYFSGFFYRHPLLSQYDYYWRVEPGVEFTCNIKYDVFKFMSDNGKKYGFVIAMQEIAETIPTLWRTIVTRVIPSIPEAISNESAITYFSDKRSLELQGYNGCHFWSNFEIASFDFYRSQEYERYFEVLDQAGGFFYERWGDAPVHSIAAGLFLKSTQIHYFEDIGYRHDPFSHCPAGNQARAENECTCQPFDFSDVSRDRCQALWSSS